ncbi:MAG: hypothetical protein O2943_08690 [Actinomycetota bacterium]|nr:hypothetical protein [Actinomycetota bacterium]
MNVRMNKIVLAVSKVRTTSAVDPVTAQLICRRRDSKVSITQIVKVPAMTE